MAVICSSAVPQLATPAGLLVNWVCVCVCTAREVILYTSLWWVPEDSLVCMLRRQPKQAYPDVVGWFGKFTGQKFCTDGNIWGFFLYVVASFFECVDNQRQIAWIYPRMSSNDTNEWVCTFPLADLQEHLLWNKIGWTNVTTIPQRKKYIRYWKQI